MLITANISQCAGAPKVVDTITFFQNSNLEKRGFYCDNGCFFQLYNACKIEFRSDAKFFRGVSYFSRVTRPARARQMGQGSKLKQNAFVPAKNGLNLTSISLCAPKVVDTITFFQNSNLEKRGVYFDNGCFFQLYSACKIEFRSDTKFFRGVSYF